MTTPRVLITGGAGFLGRGILRRIATHRLAWDPIVFSRDEMKQDICRQQYPFAKYILGDVRDTDRLMAAMEGVDFVVHAAALKYIPEAELNAAECLAVNIGGAQAVAKAALYAEVSRVIGISTDKAVQPVNVYGCSKMAMERLFAEVSSYETIFTCVRYGNVIGSTGSVIPLFRRQFTETGSVKVTDPKMTRFWMGVDEAIDLILTGLQLDGGSIAIPLVRAMTLADTVRAAVGDDTPVEITGMRPGEKMHESLLHHQESVRVVAHTDHLELLPVVRGAAPNEEGREAFTLASHTPHYRMEVDEMRKLIADTEEL
ncbi:hypothetical protein LCGC14_1219300 [marine sediment metagenome]|uniref:Polysaccharide biosynthesis protein CapD-like domain-containing protein n=1 Tax=marine sediment metagenome TaxID=412755 RepID=A0A0F9NU32_9ZZZZ